MLRAVIAALFLLLCHVGPAEAVCGSDGQGPCYRFWKVDAVFVAKVLDMVPLPDPGVEPEPGTITEPANYRLQIRVAEAFRGVKGGDVTTLFAPGGMCGGVDAEGGDELFVYASREKNGELWAQGCGVSKPLEEADADLAYARSVSVIGPLALVYGDVVQDEDRPGGPQDFPAMSGVRVVVHGQNFDAETLTDNDGNYSISLPGAGAYTIDVIPPRGFADRLGRGGAVRFEIGDPRSCFEVPFRMQRVGRIRGRVIDSDGRGIANLVVHAGNSRRFAKTDDSGAFDIGPLGEGAYSLAALTGGERELNFINAHLVKVEDGQTTSVSPVTAVPTKDLVLLSIAVNGPGEGEALVLVTSAGNDLGEPVPAGSGPVRFLVEKDQSFEIVAATMTHSAKGRIRSRLPVTEITLTLRPSPE